MLQLNALHPSLAKYTGRDEYIIPLMPSPPQLDGQVREEEWKYAARFDGLSFHGQLEERRAVCYVGATRTHLYLAFVTELPPNGEIQNAVTIHSDKIVWDDAIEVWLDA